MHKAQNTAAAHGKSDGRPTGTGTQLAIVLGLAVVYVLVFQLLIERAGPILSILLAIPVFIAGVFWGRIAGVVAGLSGFGLNVLLLTGLDGSTLSQTVRYWPGYLVILVIGYFAGYFHDDAAARRIRAGIHPQAGEGF